MTWVKICGTTSQKDAEAAVSAGADALGFIFTSSRRRITPEAAQGIIATLPRTIDKVGVFSNDPAEFIEHIARTIGLNAIQLHGDESPEFARQLFRSPDGHSVDRAKFRIFKAITVMPGVEGVLRKFSREFSVDGILLDSAVFRVASLEQPAEQIRGGTGIPFDWRRAADFVPGLARKTRVILAGGLTPENVAEAVGILKPWGVDVCTGVEACPGQKDEQKLRDFVAAVRQAATKASSY